MTQAKFKEGQEVEFDDVPGPATASEVVPEDQQVMVIPKPDNSILVEADKFSQCLKELVCETQEQYTILASYHSEAKARIKRIEDERKKLVSPFKKATEKLDEWFRGPRRKYEEIVECLRIPMAMYVQEKEHERQMAEIALRKEAERKANERRAQLEAEAKKNAAMGLTGTAEALKTQAAMVEAVVVKAPDTFKMAEDQSIRKVWTFEIVDETKIPREFLMPDEVKIRAAVRGGQGGFDIPGIRQFEDVQFASTAVR